MEDLQWTSMQTELRPKCGTAMATLLIPISAAGRRAEGDCKQHNGTRRARNPRSTTRCRAHLGDPDRRSCAGFRVEILDESIFLDQQEHEIHSPKIGHVFF